MWMQPTFRPTIQTVRVWSLGAIPPSCCPEWHASGAAIPIAKPYRTLATALEDDFDGRTAEEYARVSRHLRAALKLGAKYFRCAISWNGIEPEQGKFQ
jgi:hypothetical protein